MRIIHDKGGIPIFLLKKLSYKPQPFTGIFYRRNTCNIKEGLTDILITEYITDVK